MLDTQTCIDLIRGNPPEVRAAFEQNLGHQRPYVSSISVMEIGIGIVRGPAQSESASHARLRAFLAGPVEVLPFDEEDAAMTAEVLAQTRQTGVELAVYDLQIAAQALRHSLCLVASDCHRFSKIRDLPTDTWRKNGDRF